ncbi:hypothetical protein EDD85DRAFT_790216 [Armillaria nabsnona]|nr:hypothetical protein EDD85DRAFT_790216 [Armillaria nabsnona]
MYTRGVEGDHGVVNFIFLSRSDPSNSHPLQFILSTHLCAFDKTSDVPGISTDAYPHSVMSFWFIATNVAIDSFGVRMAIEVLCGCQIWYLFQRCDTGDKDIAINWEAEPAENEVAKDLEPGFFLDLKYWTTEVIVLKPGSALYIRPETYYAVVALENSIIKGHHFYSTVMLSKTISEWVCTQIFQDIGGLPIAHLQHILLCIMIYFGKSVKEGTNSVDFHFPKLNKMGLMNLIALGNWCFFLDVFNSWVSEQNDGTVLAIRSPTHPPTVVHFFLFGKVAFNASRMLSSKNILWITPGGWIQPWETGCSVAIQPIDEISHQYQAIFRQIWDWGGFWVLDGPGDGTSICLNINNTKASAGKGVK